MPERISQSVASLREQIETLELVIDHWAADAEVIRGTAYRSDLTPLLPDLARLRARVIVLHDALGGMARAIE